MTTPPSAPPVGSDSLIVACGAPRGSAASRWSAVYLAFIAAPIIVGISQWRDAIAVAACALIAMAVTVLSLVRHGARTEPVFRVTPDGVALGGGAYVPAARFVDIELRQWVVLPFSLQESRWVGLSVILDDGRELCVPSVTRDVRTVPFSNAAVELSADGGASWFELAEPDGSPLAWTAQTDEAVLSALRDRIDGILDPRGEAPRELEGVRGLVGTPLNSASGVARLLAPGDRSYCFTDIGDA